MNSPLCFSWCLNNSWCGKLSSELRLCNFWLFSMGTKTRETLDLIRRDTITMHHDVCNWRRKSETGKRNRVHEPSFRCQTAFSWQEAEKRGSVTGSRENPSLLGRTSLSRSSFPTRFWIELQISVVILYDIIITPVKNNRWRLEQSELVSFIDYSINTCRQPAPPVKVWVTVRINLHLCLSNVDSDFEHQWY